MDCEHYDSDAKTCSRHPELGVIHDDGICHLCQQGKFGDEPIKPKPICQWMHDTGEPVPDRPCKGTWIVCRNEKCPIHKADHVWTSCNCKASKCKFFDDGMISAVALLSQGCLRSPLWTALVELCREHGIALSGFPATDRYRQRFAAADNVVTWGVKWTHARYTATGRNVLFVENGLLSQRAGVYVDASAEGGGYFADSSIVRAAEYDAIPTAAEVERLRAHLSATLGFDLQPATDQDGPVLLALQMERDASLQHYFPHGANGANRRAFLELCRRYLPEGVPVVVRPHPREPELPSGFSMPEGWRVETGGSVYDAIRRCHAVVTVNSTVATEALAACAPVATLGRGAFTGSGATLECADTPARLAHILDWTPLPRNIITYLAAVYRNHHLPYAATRDALADNPSVMAWIRAAAGEPVPQKLHFVWLGPENDLATRCRESVAALYPGWEVFVWRDKPADWPPAFEEAWHKATLLAHKADVLRVWALWTEGGVYYDSDFVGVRPLPPEVLRRRFSCAVHRPRGRGHRIDGLSGEWIFANGLMLSRPGSPELDAIVRGWAKVGRPDWFSFGHSRLCEAHRAHGFRTIPPELCFPWARNRTRCRAFLDAAPSERAAMLGALSPCAVHLWCAGEYE